MGRPGFKVAHIEQVDMDSTCPVLVDCLQLIKSWSDANRDHVPITIMLTHKIMKPKIKVQMANLRCL